MSIELTSTVLLSTNEEEQMRTRTNVNVIIREDHPQRVISVIMVRESLAHGHEDWVRIARLDRVFFGEEARDLAALLTQALEVEES